MPHRWPADTEFRELELDVLDRACPHCGRGMHVCDHRHRRLHTFDGPLRLTCKLVHCPDRGCPGHARTASPEEEMAIAPPRWTIDWEIFCWAGCRRFARHWSVPQIQTELREAHGVRLSADALPRYLEKYQAMLAARQQDSKHLQREYEGLDEVILTIDGLQPEKGHETLYVVRELRGRRVWFAEALISATADEVRRLLVQAKEWAAALGKPVALWMSDRQDAFVSGIAEVFPGVPHRYCDNHFLRDVAKPVLEADSHAKVQMRSKVRGLRAVERAVLERRKAAAVESSPHAAAVENSQHAAAVENSQNAAAVENSQHAAAVENSKNAAAVENSQNAAAVRDPVDPAGADPAGAVVLDYCAAVRGILNDDQGGPLNPPGLRMAAALTEVQASLRRSVSEKNGASPSGNSNGSKAASRAGSRPSATSRKRSAPTSPSSGNSPRCSTPTPPTKPRAASASTR